MLRKLFIPLFIFGLLFPAWSHAAISWVTPGAGATAGCNGTTSCTTTSSPVAGDLLIAFAFRDGNATPPSVPAAWTTLANASGGASNGSVIACKDAAGGAEASGTFSSATTLVIEVYRGTATCASIQSTSGKGFCDGSTNTLTVAGTGTSCTTQLSFAVSDGTSWIFYACGHRSVNQSIETVTNSGAYTNRQNGIDATDQAANFDTNAGVSTFAGFSKSLSGTASGWSCRTQEITQAAAATGTKFSTLKAMGFY